MGTVIVLIVGGDPPTRYLVRLERHARVDDEEFQNILKSHALSPELLYADDFESFFKDRKERLLVMIENAMQKPIPREAVELEEGVYLEEDIEDEPYPYSIPAQEASRG